MNRVSDVRTRTDVLRRNGESGLALLLAIVFMLVMATITIGLANLTMSELAIVRAGDQGTQAFAIADGAIERAIAVLRLAPDWSIKNGPTINLDTTGQHFKPLYDPFQANGAGAVDIAQPYPAANPTGTYSIEIRAAASPHDNIWVRALGQTGGASRTIEVLLHRLSAADTAVYSAGTYNNQTGGNGSTTFHGSAYFFSDALIKAGVGAGVYNDRGINLGDTVPYSNQLWVRGTLDTSKGNVNIGTSPQPMYGVHAGHINNASKNIYTLELDNVVPVIMYPNVGGYVACLTTGQQCPSTVSVTSPGNAFSGGQMIVCTGVGTSKATTDLTFGSTYFYVPTASNASCLQPPANPPTVTAPTYMLVWNPGQSAPLQLNSAMAAAPLLVPGVVAATGSVTYTGVGTLVVENVNAATTAISIPNGQILAASPASGTGDALGCGYGQASSMPTSDLLAFITPGSVALQGNASTCSQENDAVFVVGASPTSTFTATSKVQVFGMVIAEQLDTTQNPAFWQVPGLQQALPGPVYQVLSFTGPQPVVIQKWHELTPSE